MVLTYIVTVTKFELFDIGLRFQTQTLDFGLGLVKNWPRFHPIQLLYICILLLNYLKLRDPFKDTKG